MTVINAYLGFQGQCREAMEFYKSCIGGELTLQTIGESAIAAQCPTGIHNHILHSTLAKGPLMLMGSDMQGPEGLIMGNNIALSLNCSNDEEINAFFTNLSEGGKINDPLKVQFWGGTFGVCTDKFGIRWMLHYDKNQNQ